MTHEDVLLIVDALYYIYYALGAIAGCLGAITILRGRSDKS